VLRKLKKIRPSLTDYKNISHEKWIEHKINEGLITEYKFDEFIEFKLIGSGAFSIVYKAILKNTANSYALKIIHNNKYTDKEIVNEIKHIISVGFHENIIKFYGVSKYKDPMDPSVVKNLLVLEYADSGTLRDYLNNNATKIGWKLKILFANQLVDAVKWLHACNIIHGDLAENALPLKLADFGISRCIAEFSESRTTSEIFGVIPYIDPQCFLEISSEKTPFKDDKDSATLPLRIYNGLREKPIFDTHHKYVAIYKKCWQGMQDDRPSIQEVAMELKDIIIQDIDVQDINIQDISNDELFDISDINNFVKYLDFHFNNQDVTNNSDEQETQDVTNNSDEQETQDVTNNSVEQETQDVTNNSDEQETHDVTDDSETQKVTNEPENDDMTIFVNKLYSTFSKLFNEGRSVSDIIINSIADGGKTNEEVFNWLSTHDNIPKYICLLGLFYSLEIGTKKENVDAIEWYTKASQGGCTITECMLGEYCYKLHKYEQAFKLLKSAADKGNALAMNTLGICNSKGYGTKVDNVKGFKSFEKVAKMGLPSSQYELGNCYEYGNGTKINLEKSLYWYQKASEKNSNYLNHVKHVKNRIELRQSSITLN
ncbi:43048_t:CDS:2, partial [Gigaspora margarita]